MLRHFSTVSLLLVLVSSALAQTATISGQVTDAQTRESLPGATVFIAESTNGTITDQDGRYVLEGVPTGAVRVYVSFVGFESQRRNLIVSEGDSPNVSFALAPSPIPLDDVTVSGESDRQWRRDLERFIEQFLGQTDNARKVTLENPLALTFTGSTRERLVAQISEPLIVDNRALGYRITYHLTQFESTRSRTTFAGEPLYHELEPADEQEAERWQQARRRAFAGSRRHFLRSLARGTLQEQGFRIAHIPERGFIRVTGSINPAPIEPEDILTPSTRDETFRVTSQSPRLVQVTYTGEDEERRYVDWWNEQSRLWDHFNAQPQQISWLLTEYGAATIDAEGRTVDPLVVVDYGYWAYHRLADALPREYVYDGDE